MALFIKTTFYFNSLQGGWSESWHNLTAGSLTVAEGDARLAGMKRLAICGLGTSLVAIRISDQDQTPKRSKLVDLQGNGIGGAPIVADAALTGYSDALTRSADQLQSALLVRGLSSTSQRKHIWLGGIPDFIVRTNPIGPDVGGPGSTWLTKYTLWRAEFQSAKWGFRVRRRLGADVQPQNVIDWVVQAGALSRLGALVNNGGPVYAPGQTIQIRNVKVLNRAFRNPNGLWTVHSSQAGTPANTTVYFLRGTEGIDPANIFAPGNIRLVDFEAVPVTDLQIIRQASHKRGRPFGLFRGRQTTPPRA